MTSIVYRPLAFASVLLLALAACAAAPPTTAPANTITSTAVDLGPSSRVPPMRIAMAGAVHAIYRASPDDAASPTVQPVHDGHDDAHATGTVNAVDPAQHKINLSHNPIPDLGWPAMTMEFPVVPTVDLSRVKPGSRVNFTIMKGKGGMYEVQSVQPAGAGK